MESQQHPLADIVEAIADLTRQKDMLAVEGRFFAAIRNIWPDMACWLVKTPWDSYPSRDNLIVHGDRATLPVDMALLAMQLKGRSGLGQREHAGRHYITARLPQPYGEEDELLLLAGSRSLNPTELRLLDALVTIYLNQLDLLQAGDRDILTGLICRKQLQNRMTDQLTARIQGRRYRDAGDADYLVLVNIDHFGHINEQYGHLAADRVLQQAARVISDSLQDVDQVFRQAGDGFACLLCDVGPGMIGKVCERLRRGLADTVYDGNIQVTASIGNAILASDRLPQDILERASTALAHAKEHGRDQVRAYEELLAEGLATDSSAERPVELF